MRSAALVTILAGLLAAESGPLCAANAGWKSVRPQAARMVLPRGKTLRRVPSPNRRYVLLYRDEGQKGDFFWRTVYLQRGRSYVPLAECNDLRRVRWRADSGRVRFEVDRAVDPNEMDRLELEYRPRTNTLRQQRIGKLKVEGAG
jgi:hypothetical protein